MLFRPRLGCEVGSDLVVCLVGRYCAAGKALRSVRSSSALIGLLVTLMWIARQILDGRRIIRDQKIGLGLARSFERFGKRGHRRDLAPLRLQGHARRITHAAVVLKQQHCL
jgi:hypothetical protein